MLAHFAFETAKNLDLKGHLFCLLQINDTIYNHEWIGLGGLGLIMVSKWIHIYTPTHFSSMEFKEKYTELKENRNVMLWYDNLQNGQE